MMEPHLADTTNRHLDWQPRIIWIQILLWPLFHLKTPGARAIMVTTSAESRSSFGEICLNAGAMMPQSGHMFDLSLSGDDPSPSGLALHAIILVLSKAP